MKTFFIGPITRRVIDKLLGGRAGPDKASLVSFDGLTIELDAEDRMHIHLLRPGHQALSYGPYCMLPGDQLVLGGIRGHARLERP